jgi:hypothetical protein
MTTPSEREHDQWARQYMAAVLRRDTGALIALLTDLNPATSWDRLDAVSAVARDVIEATAGVDAACTVLAARLVRDALAESTTRTDGTH